MNTITITTSQNIELEFELASLGDRILAYLIDFVVIIAYVIIILSAFVFRSFGLSTFILILFFLPVVFYDLVSELLLNGQSLGKKLRGIRVISITGNQPSLSQYLNRWIFRLVDFSISSNMVAVIIVAATEKKQRLGDLFAGTVLVKTKSRTTISDTLYQPINPSTYAVTYPEVVNLRDSDVQLIKEVMISVRRTNNTELAYQSQQKVEQILHIQSRHHEPMSFLQTVLADYNHLTSQL